ncbi:P-loop containing nucleoside triphosphate hydrolase protein [Pelagophyceae sp. CCMP2097]|nr:P-loop containing nucleoside triphosphate hydrolase protein [Pelagophyceae sp. CCMP2097]
MERQKSVLESAELSVHWRDVSVHFGPKRALAPCSGDVAAGELTALMGPTGAGKTTLLNAISHRGPVTSGDVWYGDDYEWSKAMKRYVAYIEQDDVVFPNLTVYETLIFSSRLRLPDASMEEKKSKVDDMISLLRLDPCKHSKVGGGMVRGVSGGERKRLMVCQEMLTEPRLLACDEPTSGLDSTTATVVMEALGDLARQRRVAIVASIHQPSSRIFLLFDHLHVLDRGGTVYRGPTSLCGSAFAESPYDLPCPPSWSAPDWIIECIVETELQTFYEPPKAATADGDEDAVKVVGFEGESVAHRRRREALIEAYGVSSLPARALGMGVTVKARPQDAYAAPFSEQVFVLFQRIWKEVWPMVFDVSAVQLHVGIALIYGSMWWRLQHAEKDIFPRITIAFCVPIAWVFFPLLSSLGVVPSNEQMLKKELAVNAFRLSVWYCVTTTLLLIPMFVQSCMFLVIVFVLSNLSATPAVFFGLYGVLVMAMLTFQSIGLFFSAAVPPGQLTTVAMLFVTFCFVFTGLFVPLNQTLLPWLCYINPMFYIMILSTYVVIGLDAEAYTCGNNFARDGTIFPNHCSEAGANGDIGPKAIFEAYKVDRVTPGYCVLALLIFCFAARLMAFFILDKRMLKHRDAVQAPVKIAEAIKAEDETKADAVARIENKADLEV